MQFKSTMSPLHIKNAICTNFVNLGLKLVLKCGKMVKGGNQAPGGEI